MVQVNAVRAWLKKTSAVQVSDDWLQACLEWISEENQGRELAYQELGSLVYEQWLLSDLHELQTPVLPPDVATAAKFQLQGSFALQVDSIVDAGTPYYGQLQKIQGKENANAAVTAEPPTQNQWQPKASRMLLLKLTDGCLSVKGMEYRPIPTLHAQLSPGTKILIRGQCMCRRGMLMLTPDIVTVLGGEVDSLVETNTQESLLKAAIQDGLGSMGRGERRNFSGRFTARPNDDCFDLKGCKSSGTSGSVKPLKSEVVDLEAEFEEDMDYEALMALDEMEAQAVDEGMPRGRSTGQTPQGTGANTHRPVAPSGGTLGRGENSASRPHLAKLRSQLSNTGSSTVLLGQNRRKESTQTSKPFLESSSGQGQPQMGRNPHQPQVRSGSSNPVPWNSTDREAAGFSSLPDEDEDLLMAEELFANDSSAFLSTPSTSSGVNRNSSCAATRPSNLRKTDPYVGPDEEDLLLEEELFADDEAFDEVLRPPAKLSESAPEPTSRNQSGFGQSVSHSVVKREPAALSHPLPHSSRSLQTAPTNSSPRELKPLFKAETTSKSPLFAQNSSGCSKPNLQHRSPMQGTSATAAKKPLSGRQQTLDSMFLQNSDVSGSVGGAEVKQEPRHSGRVKSTASASPVSQQTPVRDSPRDATDCGGRADPPRAVIHPFLSSPPDDSLDGHGQLLSDTDRLTYLSTISGLNSLTPGTSYTVKAYISTLTSRLDYAGGQWCISCKINDGTASLDVQLSNRVLTELIGFSAEDAMEMKLRAKRDPSVRDVLTEGIQGCQQQLIALCCLMEVKASDPRPTVTSLRRPSTEHVTQLQADVDRFLATLGRKLQQ